MWESEPGRGSEVPFLTVGSAGFLIDHVYGPVRGSEVPSLRLVAVAVTSVAAVALGVLAVRLRSKPRPTRRVAAVVVVTIVLASGLLVPSLFRPAIEGQEVLIGQRFAHPYHEDVTIRSVECSEVCVATFTRTLTVGFTHANACGGGRNMDPFVSLIGRRGTVYEPRGPLYPTCSTVLRYYSAGTTNTDEVAFDVAGNGLVDLFDVRGNDEVAAVFIRYWERMESPDRYALIDPYTDQPGRWAAVAVGLVKLLLLALAGAAGAAVSKMVPKMVLVIKRRGQVPDLPPASVVAPDTAKRALSGLVRSDRPGQPDASE